MYAGQAYLGFVIIGFVIYCGPSAKFSTFFTAMPPILLSHNSSSVSSLTDNKPPPMLFIMTIMLAWAAGLIISFAYFSFIHWVSSSPSSLFSPMAMPWVQHISLPPSELNCVHIWQDVMLWYDEVMLMRACVMPLPILWCRRLVTHWLWCLCSIAPWSIQTRMSPFMTQLWFPARFLWYSWEWHVMGVIWAWTAM